MEVPPTAGEYAYAAAESAQRQNDRLAARVAALENAILDIVNWSEEVSDAINHLANHCKCKGVENEQD